MSILWIAQVRAFRWKVVGYLLVSMIGVLVTSTVTVQLRTPADRAYLGPVLERGVLVGLVPAAVILTSLLQDRSPWLAVTSPRPQVPLRAAWLGVLILAMLVTGLTAGAAMPAQIDAGLVAADFAALFALALGGAVVLGRPLAWIPPALVALACSVPGLVPIHANWLSLSERAPEVGVLAAAGVSLFGAIFVMIDEYGVMKYRRVFQRMPGVHDD